MGLFGSNQLDYRAGEGNLPKMKPSTYFPHRLPGQISAVQMNFGLLSEEAKSGRHKRLLDKAVDFAATLEYLNADFQYTSQPMPMTLTDENIKNPGESSDESIAFLANLVSQQIDNQAKIYFELLPYLEEFERKLGILLSSDERRVIMFLFRVGMGLSLIENLSTLYRQGFCHPSISNLLSGPRQVMENMLKREIRWNLDLLGGTDAQLDVSQTALYVGYFQSKYTAESPASVMECVSGVAK